MYMTLVVCPFNSLKKEMDFLLQSAKVALVD